MTYAMILCAGFGTRLNELTKDTPKPMLKVGDKPILEHTISHLRKFGITKIIINLHYLPEQITSYFGNGEKFGVEIFYSYEDQPLGTSGAIKKVGNTLLQAKNFLVIYGDILTDLNYSDLIKFHESKNNDLASIIVHERAKSNSIVEINGENRVVKFVERPSEEQLGLKTQNWVNSGIYCFDKKVLELIPEGFSDFPKDIFPKIMQQEGLYALPLKGYRCAVDSVERYSML
jgi:NDP-sugar pyrophosphorylase family protein